MSFFKVEHSGSEISFLDAEGMAFCSCKGYIPRMLTSAPNNLELSFRNADASYDLHM